MERPIFFDSDMVQAILAGKKTVARRIARVPRRPGYTAQLSEVFADPGLGDGGYLQVPYLDSVDRLVHRVRCPYGSPGDRLWVRETWAPWSEHLDQTGEAEALRVVKEQMPWAHIEYRADSSWSHHSVRRWRPAIHMPRWASRITLEITSIRAERLHDITEEDAKREGVGPHSYPYCAENKRHREGFATLWDKVYCKRKHLASWAPWSSNPFVWRIEFVVK